MAVGAFSLVAFGANLGCKGDDKGASPADVKKVAAVSSQISTQEDDILARRDALFKARNQIVDERTKLRVKYD